MKKEYITMTKKELHRYEIIKKTIEKRITEDKASQILNLASRQIRRIKKQVREKGIEGVIHQSRGKPSNRKMPEKEKGKIKELLRKYYSDFKPGFAAEKLRENHRINRDPKTIRAVMIEENLWKPKSKKRKEHRAWRQRKTSPGEMVQYDGSYEYWFEDRAPKCCLLASVDDADNKVNAKFDEHEGVFPTCDFWKEYLKEKGKPLSIYVDKFSTYSMNHKQAKENPDTLTQFQHAMGELNIEIITAHSSQAKGRVERLFSTLQDRLIKELRLNNISTIKKANKFLREKFLPEFNKKFMVEPRGKTDLHATLSSQERKNLNSILCRNETRIVRNDFTVNYKKRWYQILKEQPVTVYKKDEVTVEEHRNGKVFLKLRGRKLNCKSLPERPRRETSRKDWVIAPKVKYRKPASNHPWRKQIAADVKFKNH
jgi:hypothetical protein